MLFRRCARFLSPHILLLWQQWAPSLNMSVVTAAISVKPNFLKTYPNCVNPQHAVHNPPTHTAPIQPRKVLGRGKTSQKQQQKLNETPLAELIFQWQMGNIRLLHCLRLQPCSLKIVEHARRVRWITFLYTHAALSHKKGPKCFTYFRCWHIVVLTDLIGTHFSLQSQQFSMW